MCGVCERGKMYIVGSRGLLKVSGTTPFVYQLLMTLLVMMLQLVLVMRPQLAMMLTATGDSCRAMGAWCWQCSWYPCGLQLLVRVKELPHKWTNVTIHITKVAICCVHD